MSTRTVKVSRRVCQIGNVHVGMHTMSGGGDEASIALSFKTESLTGLQASFHGTVTEMRAFVAALNEHIDAADSATAELEGGAA